jgi:N-acetylneuraminate synthase
MGIGVSVAAVALGACVIEKHFTLCRDEGGVDSQFSIEPSELKSLTEEALKAWQAIGSINYGMSEAEKKNLIYRRSVYVSADIAEGETFGPNNIRIVRPGHGMQPAYYEKIIGLKARKQFKAGMPLRLEDLF